MNNIKRKNENGLLNRLLRGLIKKKISLQPQSMSLPPRQMLPPPPPPLPPAPPKTLAPPPLPPRRAPVIVQNHKRPSIVNNFSRQ